MKRTQAPTADRQAAQVEHLESSADDGLSAFISQRSRLFGIAYRMLGNAADAEDIVQDVWVRWQMADRRLVRNAEAFLAAATARLAINDIQSARSRRETQAGAWPMEPVDTSVDPRSAVEQREALELGVLLLVKNLEPVERAAFILREAFDYSYRDIAGVLRLKEPNARQVVTRARQHLGSGRRRTVRSQKQRHLVHAMVAAARHGDIVGLEHVLTSEVGFPVGAAAA